MGEFSEHRFEKGEFVESVDLHEDNTFYQACNISF